MRQLSLDWTLARLTLIIMRLRIVNRDKVVVFIIVLSLLSLSWPIFAYLHAIGAF